MIAGIVEIVESMMLVQWYNPWLLREDNKLRMMRPLSLFLPRPRDV